MTDPSAEQFLELARSHLTRAQSASWEPDWTDLSTYAFYCLEAAVMAAATHVGMALKRTHADKSRAASALAERFGLPSIAHQLSELNTARKAMAYGDTSFPELNAEDVATEVEAYVEAVAELLTSTDT